MKTKLLLHLLAVLALEVLSTTSSHSQTVITFDNPPLNTGTGSYIVSPYEGLSWSNFGRVNGVLAPTVYPFVTNGSYYGIVSGSNVAINGLGEPAEIDSATNFDFLSAYLTGVWNSNLNIDVQGFVGATLLYETTVVASATSPTLFTFNYMDIDRLYFSSSGGELAFGTSPAEHFAMDNFTFEFIPEPSSLLLAAVGGISLVALLRRRQA
jgi:hypothetical protein